MAQCVKSSQPGIICLDSDLAYLFSCTRGLDLFPQESKLETFVYEQKCMSRFPCKLEHSLKACTLSWSWSFQSSPLERGFTSSWSFYLAHPAAITWHFMRWDGVEAAPAPAPGNKWFCHILFLMRPVKRLTAGSISQQTLGFPHWKSTVV